MPLTASSLSPEAADILQAALQAVEPGAAVEKYLQLEGECLRVAKRSYELSRYRRVLLAGAGKAAAPMAAAAARRLGPHLSGGVLVTKEAHAADLPASLRLHEAGHPLPDERGVDAGREILALLEAARADDLVICLISGGGSALLTSPVPGISLEDLQTLTRLLLASGATIHEINCLRKHLDAVKGGGLARAACPATLVTLALSDVVGDHLDVIASGPTVPDPTTFADAWNVLERYHLVERVPASIREHLGAGRGGQLPDTPKPGDALFEKVQNVIVGSNRQAAEAARCRAQQAGYHTLLLTTFLQGEARQAGRFLAAIARQVASDGHPLPRPACLIAGGETTVTLNPSSAGLGGRNQEMALAAVSELAGLEGITFIALATDGGDGPTDAAGAVVTGQTLARAAALGLHPADFLAGNDAYHFFEPLGDLLKPGPTRTNVNDLAIVLAK